MLGRRRVRRLSVSVADDAATLRVRLCFLVRGLMTRSRRPLQRSLGTLVLACLLAVGPSATADAATYSTSVSPGSFSYSASQQLVYRLHVTTGAAAERLQVTTGPEPRFSGGGVAVRFSEMTLEGPGTVVDSRVITMHGDPACAVAPVFPFAHGVNLQTTPTLEVDIPANVTTVVALPARLVHDAPWRTMNLAVEFRIGEPPATPAIVRSQNPMNMGPYGVPIAVATDPTGEPYPCFPWRSSPFFAPRSVPLGKEVRLLGKTDPLVAGQLMTIRTERAGETAKDIATVRIGPDGAFSYLWRPPTPGDHAIGAHYRSQTPTFTNDFSGPIGLRVTPPVVKATPTAITSARRARCRGRRCVITVHGTVRRPAAASTARCAGKARLRVATGSRRMLSSRVAVSGGWRYRATRRFRLRSPNARFVTVRVSYLGDATLAPKQGPATRTKIRRVR